MKNQLLEFRKQLVSMIEFIDNYKPSLDDEIIIQKDDFKYLKWVKKINSYINLFEYKNSIRFTLPDSGSSYQYEVSFYKKIMDGSIDRLILNKLQLKINNDNVEDETDEYRINYKLEEWQKTKLRDQYGKSEDQNVKD